MFLFIRCDTSILMKHEYDQKSLVPMLLKCYEHLQHISRTLDSQSTQMDTNVVK
jgi:hypothetical protein